MGIGKKGGIMGASEHIAAQLADPFRIALLVGLFYTTLRNRAVTGFWLPLACGAGFVAVLIPLTLGGMQGAEFWQQLGTGLISNAVILAVLLALWAAYRKLRPA